MESQGRLWWIFIPVGTSLYTDVPEYAFSRQKRAGNLVWTALFRTPDETALILDNLPESMEGSKTNISRIVE